MTHGCVNYACVRHRAKTTDQNSSIDPLLSTSGPGGQVCILRKLGKLRRLEVSQVQIAQIMCVAIAQLHQSSISQRRLL